VCVFKTDNVGQRGRGGGGSKKSVFGRTSWMDETLVDGH